MKKTYMTPATTTVAVKINQIMAGSMGFGGETEATSGNLSRRRGNWSDDDEE